MEILDNFSSIYCFITFIMGAMFMLVTLCIAAMGKMNEPTNKVHFYVTRDRASFSKGMLNLWINKPTKSDIMWYSGDRWTSHIVVEKYFKHYGLNPSDYDNLKWEDEPVEVFINMEE